LLQQLVELRTKAGARAFAGLVREFFWASISILASSHNGTC
jgi:hypothetical protein